jgi:hypothetical protein
MFCAKRTSASLNDADCGSGEGWEADDGDDEPPQALMLSINIALKVANVALTVGRTEG